VSNIENIKRIIDDGKTVLGIELGSTRIKAVLIDQHHKPIASGDHEWENRLENGYWTYSLEDIWKGLRDSYQKLRADVKASYHTELTAVKSLGFSAMMHGYMAFDKTGKLLAPFRTWRNGTTGSAAEKLTKLFQYNIPERWSVAHLYQAILNGEAHVKDIDYVTTLSGYIHWQLTGKRVIGVGDASGMFPVNTGTYNYDAKKVEQFNELIAKENYIWKLEDILPKVLVAGEHAGVLTEYGAKLLDASGSLKAGVPLCPPEGDAGTGMVATNSVARRTGNVSAGTSIFAMVVLEQELKKIYSEIDMVTTPDGQPVAMVHANNCTSDLNAWVGIFKEFAESLGMETDMNQLYRVLYNKALEGDADCGGLLSYGFLSGEQIMKCAEGRPLFVRMPQSRFNLANFMRVHLFAALGALKVGMDILLKEEGVVIDSILGHGGLFKTKGVAQRFLAAAIETPVSVMETAGEGGAWGMALLAAYMIRKEEEERLDEYLARNVFTGKNGTKIDPNPMDVEGFKAFTERYIKGISIEQSAVGLIAE